MNFIFLAVVVIFSVLSAAQALSIVMATKASNLKFKLNTGINLTPRSWFRKATVSTLASIISIGPFGIFPQPVSAKTELPSLEKCFNAVRKEIDQGESLSRLSTDVKTSNWDDILSFTREYDAGFRNGVLKSAWKQFDNGTKMKGIQISNSFTFDLIGLNKAARNQDADDAAIRLLQIRQDLVDFLALESINTNVQSSE